MSLKQVSNKRVCYKVHPHSIGSIGFVSLEFTLRILQLHVPHSPRVRQFGVAVSDGLRAKSHPSGRFIPPRFIRPAIKVYGCVDRPAQCTVVVDHL